MTPDQMNPAICPSALDEHGNLERPAMMQDIDWGKHRWDTTRVPTTCAECGTERDRDTDPKPDLYDAKCPLCSSVLQHEQVNGTHIYKCEPCPFIGLEFYSDKDITNLASAIN